MAEHSQVNRNRHIARTTYTRATPIGSSIFPNKWSRLFLLSALILLWATALAAGAADSAGKAEAGRPEGAFPASRLIGMAVNDARGHSIAEIEDFVMNGEGIVEQAILAVGGVAGMGEKLVAVPFEELILTQEWNKRPVRTQSGTTADVKWERQMTAVYREGAAALSALQEYTYPDEHPRGGPSGWGVYSYPAGPSPPGAVTQPKEVTGGGPQ
jgi:sporulation protein YlmC with PRC-barrel domain